MKVSSATKTTQQRTSPAHNRRHAMKQQLRSNLKQQTVLQAVSGKERTTTAIHQNQKQKQPSEEAVHNLLQNLPMADNKYVSLPIHTPPVRKEKKANTTTNNNNNNKNSLSCVTHDNVVKDDPCEECLLTCDTYPLPDFAECGGCVTIEPEVENNECLLTCDLSPMPDFEEFQSPTMTFDQPVPRRATKQKNVVITFTENVSTQGKDKVFVHSKPTSDGASWGGWVLLPSVSAEYGRVRQITLPTSTEEPFVFSVRHSSKPCSGSAFYTVDPTSTKRDTIDVICTPDGCAW